VGEGLVPGLVKGLAQTARTLSRRTHTVEYPDVAPALPPRSRGVIALTEENCTSCMLCARECPDWCIYIDSHKEEVPPTTPGGRARQRNVLDRFAIDFSLCMYCGICIEACPFDALHWSPEFEYAETDIRDLLHEKDRLGAWMATVPPPPALDPGSAEPAEIAAASRPARGARADGPAQAGTRPTRVRPERDAAPGTVAPPAESASAPDEAPTRRLPVAEAADQAAAQGDSTQVMPTVSSGAPADATRVLPATASGDEARGADRTDNQTDDRTDEQADRDPTDEEGRA
jgi:NADH-quinone oxidoreductase subunit I